MVIVSIGTRQLSLLPCSRVKIFREIHVFEFYVDNDNEMRSHTAEKVRSLPRQLTNSKVKQLKQFEKYIVFVVLRIVMFIL